MADYPALDLTYRQGEGAGDLVERLYASLDDFDPSAIHEHEAGDGLRVFFRDAAMRDAAVAALHSRFGESLRSVSPVDVADEGWARRSQARLAAVRIGRVVVAPPWAPEAGRSDLRARCNSFAAGPGQDDIVVVIEPSMGFGTGHHATTRLCLELLQRLDLEGRYVVDIGTGSGVLAIAARALGACGVTAVDCDPDALQNARENVRRNGAQGTIELVEADVAELDRPAADVVLANLTGSALQRYAARLLALLLPAGRILVSGFPPDDLPSIERAFGRRAHESMGEQGWAAAVFHSGTECATQTSLVPD